MSKRNDVTHNTGAPATPPPGPRINRWSAATAAARTQRELVMLSLRLCPGSERTPAR